MVLGKVVGSIVSTIKHDVLHSRKLLIIKPITPQGEFMKGAMVAVDTVDAGEGDTVIVSSEGKAAKEILEFNKLEPLRSLVVGVVDEIK
ncbi:MAG: EutN/CcmL family microcompartment protein [Ignavibacteria bacterium]|jgi:microcompartment protein CcmK/EutM